MIDNTVSRGCELILTLPTRTRGPNGEGSGWREAGVSLLEEVTCKQEEDAGTTHPVMDWSWECQGELAFSLPQTQTVTHGGTYRNVYLHRVTYTHTYFCSASKSAPDDGFLYHILQPKEPGS